MIYSREGGVIHDWSAPLFTQNSDNGTTGPKIDTNPQAQKTQKFAHPTESK